MQIVTKIEKSITPILLMLWILFVIGCDVASVGHKFATACEEAAWPKSELYSVRVVLLVPDSINATFSVTDAKSFTFYGDLKSFNCEGNYQSSLVFTAKNTFHATFKDEIPLPSEKFLFEGDRDYLNLNGRMRIILNNGQTWESSLHSERCLVEDLLLVGSEHEMYLALKNKSWWQIAE